MTRQKICGHIDCGRYDTDDVLCDFCECNGMLPDQHSAPDSTTSESDYRDVGTLTDVWY